MFCPSIQAFKSKKVHEEFIQLFVRKVSTDAPSKDLDYAAFKNQNGQGGGPSNHFALCSAFVLPFHPEPKSFAAHTEFCPLRDLHCNRVFLSGACVACRCKLLLSKPCRRPTSVSKACIRV